jgi:hypothetical protein
MGRRISVYIDDDVLDALNAHTQASPLSRSELVGVAVRRFLRDERRRARTPNPTTQLAKRIAQGDVPSRKLDGRTRVRVGAPWDN